MFTAQQTARSARSKCPGQRDHSPSPGNGAKVFAPEPGRWSPRAGPHGPLAAGPAVAPLKGKRGHHGSWRNATIDICHHGDCRLPRRVQVDGDTAMGRPSHRPPPGSRKIGCFGVGFRVVREKRRCLPPDRPWELCRPASPLSGARWLHFSSLSCLALQKTHTFRSWAEKPGSRRCGSHHRERRQPWKHRRFYRA